MSANSTSLDFALALWRLGLSVIPVPRPGRVHDGKRPAILWKEFQQRRATQDELREWFVTEQNIAIVTGRISGVAVVDADSEEAVRWVRRNMLRTPWRVRTPRGCHFYYRWPGVAVQNRARIKTATGQLALDVRGDGGYVIGPGSIHASGAHYQAEGDWSVSSAKLPAFWVGLLERSRRAHFDSRPTAGVASDQLVARARAYLRAIPRPQIGQGSDTATFQAACHLVRGFGLEADTAASLLQEWAPDFDREWIDGKVTSAVKYGDEPVGDLR